MSDAVESLVARIDHLAWSWTQGARVRPAELKRLVEEVHALASSSPPDVVERLVGRVRHLSDALLRARSRAESELAAIPARRRAIRAQLQPKFVAPGTRLRKRA
ncbi:MAG: hypothetical protein FJ102_10580 [Deltaproteobacteria bacterium]|nr:hypothetical protein [Deltaproteobacteria bacterium]